MIFHVLFLTWKFFMCHSFMRFPYQNWILETLLNYNIMKQPFRYFLQRRGLQFFKRLELNKKKYWIMRFFLIHIAISWLLIVFKVNPFPFLFYSRFLFNLFVSELWGSYTGSERLYSMLYLLVYSVYFSICEGPAARIRFLGNFKGKVYL